MATASWKIWWPFWGGLLHRNNIPPGEYTYYNNNSNNNKTPIGPKFSFMSAGVEVPLHKIQIQPAGFRPANGANVWLNAYFVCSAQ